MDHGSGYSNPHWRADSPLIKKDPFNVPARGLNIVWGNYSRYWQWNKIKEEERKIQAEEAAVLLQVNWLEVTGKIDLNNSFVANQAYTIYYVIKFRADAFGWHSAPIKFKVRVNGEETGHETHVLESYRVKHDEWHEVPGGDFVVPTKAEGSVEFGMFEIDSDWWKGSMVIAGIKISPKHDG